MFSWRAWPTLELDPRMQVMATRRRLKFSRPRSHRSTVLYIRSRFSASFTVLQEHRGKWTGSSRGVKYYWSEGGSFYFENSCFILVSFGSFMSTVARAKGRMFCLMGHLD